VLKQIEEIIMFNEKYIVNDKTLVISKKYLRVEIGLIESDITLC